MESFLTLIRKCNNGFYNQKPILWLYESYKSVNPLNKIPTVLNIIRMGIAEGTHFERNKLTSFIIDPLDNLYPKKTRVLYENAINSACIDYLLHLLIILLYLLTYFQGYLLYHSFFLSQFSIMEWWKWKFLNFLVGQLEILVQQELRKLFGKQPTYSKKNQKLKNLILTN